MNHQELEEIRARTTDDAAWHPRLVHKGDAASLLAELDRKWRLLEYADAKINEVRIALEHAEYAHYVARDLQGTGRALTRLRKIVGPR